MSAKLPARAEGDAQLACIRCFSRFWLCFSIAQALHGMVYVSYICVITLIQPSPLNGNCMAIPLVLFGPWDALEWGTYTASIFPLEWGPHESEAVMVKIHRNN